jgi:sugar-specific transcriptional regulator TrmB
MVRDLNEALGVLGLTQYEAKVYKTIASEGASTAKDISNICGIPYGKIYEVISSLGKKGFVEVLPTKPMKYRAVDPTDVVKQVKDAWLRKIELAEKLVISELKSSFQRTKETAGAKGFFWIINGRTAVNKKVNEMLQKAEKHICISATENGLERLKSNYDTLTQKAKKGVKVTIHSSAGPANEFFSKTGAFGISNAKKELRNMFISVDGSESFVFEANPDDTNLNYGRDSGIWFSNTSFSNFMETLFVNCHRNSGET